MSTVTQVVWPDNGSFWDQFVPVPIDAYIFTCYDANCPCQKIPKEYISPCASDSDSDSPRTSQCNIFANASVQFHHVPLC